MSADDDDALVLPGGVANPDQLRTDEAVALARAFLEAGKPVAAICRGPWTLVEDLPAFCARLVEEVAAGGPEGRAEAVGA